MHQPHLGYQLVQFFQVLALQMGEESVSQRGLRKPRRDLRIE